MHFWGVVVIQTTTVTNHLLRKTYPITAHWVRMWSWRQGIENERKGIYFIVFSHLASITKHKWTGNENCLLTASKASPSPLCFSLGQRQEKKVPVRFCGSLVCLMPSKSVLANPCTVTVISTHEHLKIRNALFLEQVTSFHCCQDKQTSQYNRRISLCNFLYPCTQGWAHTGIFAWPSDTMGM